MGSQLNASRLWYEGATRRITALESEKGQLETELGEIKRNAANVPAIDNQNKNLRQQLTDAEINVSILEQENEGLASKTTRNWFITGALVLLGGVLLGEHGKIRQIRQHRHHALYRLSGKKQPGFDHAVRIQ